MFSIFTVAYKLTSTLALALEQGNHAVGAIIDYSSILNMLMHIRGLSNETAQRTMDQGNFLSGDMLLRDTSVVNLSNHLLYISQGQYSEIQNLSVFIDSAVMQEDMAPDKVAGLNDIVIQLTSDVIIHGRATNLAVSDVNETLVHITDQLNTVLETSVEILSTSSLLLSSTPLLLADLNTTLSVSVMS